MLPDWVLPALVVVLFGAVLIAMLRAFAASDGAPLLDEPLVDPTVPEGTPGGPVDLVPVAVAELTGGGDRVGARGEVALYEGAGGPFLQFRSVELDPAPGVRFRVLEAPDGDEGGPVPGPTLALSPGADEGGAQGTFLGVPPASLTVRDVLGVEVWSEDLAMVMGRALFLAPDA